MASHQSMRQAARRSALDAQAYCARNVPKRPTHAPPGHSNSDQAATLLSAAGAALCIQLDGVGR